MDPQHGYGQYQQQQYTGQPPVRHSSPQQQQQQQQQQQPPLPGPPRNLIPQPGIQPAPQQQQQQFQSQQPQFAPGPPPIGQMRPPPLQQNRATEQPGPAPQLQPIRPPFAPVPQPLAPHHLQHQPLQMPPRNPSVEQVTRSMGQVGLGPSQGQQPVTGLVGVPPDVNIFRKAPPSTVQPPVCSDFIRSSLCKIPRSQALLSKVKAPLGLTVTPFPKMTELDVPVLNSFIVRCRRCRSYLNPYVEQIDQGARWRCNLCLLVNDYPPAYDVDQATGNYMDRSQRPELGLPVYDFNAPVEYTTRPPQPPIYVFVLDASYMAVSTGMLATAAKVLLDSLDSLPNEQEMTRVGIVAVDTAVHYFRFSSGTPTGEPEVLVVADVSDTTVPSRVDDLVVNLCEHRTEVEAVLRKLPMLFANTQKADCAFGSAVSAVFSILQPLGGRIISLLSSMPKVGQGALRDREDPKLYGTAKEVSLLMPALTFYKDLAAQMGYHQISTDLLLFPSSYVDVCSLGGLAKHTGGQLMIYPGFNASRPADVVKFTSDFSKLLQDGIGVEAVFRVRATQGLSITSYSGSFNSRTTDLLGIANVSSDHSFTAHYSIEEALPCSLIGFQAALLYTTCSGVRRIRVINGCYPVSDDASDILRWIDTAALVDIMAKSAVVKAADTKIEAGKDYVVSKTADILSAFRTANNMGPNPQLQVCDSLRALPLLALGATKSLALRPTANVPVDIRSFYMTRMSCNAVDDNAYLFCPYLLPIHLLPESAGQLPQSGDVGDMALPPGLNVSSERIERHGIYLLDDGRDLVFYVGAGASPEACQQLFSEPYHRVIPGKVGMPRFDGPMGKRIGNIVRRLELQHANSPVVFIVKEDSEPALRAIFFSRLVEDRGGADALPAYQQFVNLLRDKSSG